jgi:hypothetical protein
MKTENSTDHHETCAFAEQLPICMGEQPPMFLSKHSANHVLFQGRYYGLD